MTNFEVVLYDRLYKEAKQEFFEEVRKDLKENQAAKRRGQRYYSRSNDELFSEYRAYLSGYNKVAQKSDIPIGVIIYAALHKSNGTNWWLNYMRPGSGYFSYTKMVERFENWKQTNIMLAWGNYTLNTNTPAAVVEKALTTNLTDLKTQLEGL